MSGVLSDVRERHRGTSELEAADVDARGLEIVVVNPDGATSVPKSVTVQVKNPRLVAAHRSAARLVTSRDYD